MGDFKGNVNKSLRELATRMEAGFWRMETRFGKIETSMEKICGELKGDIKPLVWQVHILLGGASLVCIIYYS